MNKEDNLIGLITCDKINLLTTAIICEVKLCKQVNFLAKTLKCKGPVTPSSHGVFAAF